MDANDLTDLVGDCLKHGADQGVPRHRLADEFVCAVRVLHLADTGDTDAEWMEVARQLSRAARDIRGAIEYGKAAA